MTLPSGTPSEALNEQKAPESAWRGDPELIRIVQAVNREMTPTINDRYDGWAIAVAAVNAYQRRPEAVPRRLTAESLRAAMMAARVRLDSELAPPGVPDDRSWEQRVVDALLGAPAPHDEPAVMGGSVDNPPPTSTDYLMALVRELVADQTSGGRCEFCLEETHLSPCIIGKLERALAAPQPDKCSLGTIGCKGERRLVEASSERMIRYQCSQCGLTEELIR